MALALYIYCRPARPARRPRSTLGSAFRNHLARYAVRIEGTSGRYGCCAGRTTLVQAHAMTQRTFLLRDARTRCASRIGERNGGRLQTVVCADIEAGKTLMLFGVCATTTLDRKESVSTQLGSHCTAAHESSLAATCVSKRFFFSANEFMLRLRMMSGFVRVF
ncbi:hypothetical protein MRX96_002114 [Rhipicephalus microplus]